MGWGNGRKVKTNPPQVLASLFVCLVPLFKILVEWMPRRDDARAVPGKPTLWRMEYPFDDSQKEPCCFRREHWSTFARLSVLTRYASCTAAIRKLYRWLGWEMTDDIAARMSRWQEEKAEHVARRLQAPYWEDIAIAGA